MAIRNVNGKGSINSVPSNLRFADTNERDTYFVSYPNKLKDNLYITVANELQMYSEVDTTWYSAAATIAGTDGSDAPQVLIQYSSDQVNYHDNFSTNDEFIRYSTDNGTSWGSGMKFVADDLLIQYSTNGTSGWHITRTDSDSYWRWSTDGGLSFSNAAQFATSNSGIPSPYSASVIDGRLAFLDGTGDVVLSLNEDGLWTKAVTTSTGSLHLSETYSIGGGGDSLAYVMEDEGISHYLSKGILSIDGNYYTPTKDRVYSDLSVVEPNGSVDNNVVDYNFSLIINSTAGYEGVSFFRISLISAEDYSGDLEWICKNTATDSELATFKVNNVTLVEGNEYVIVFEYPLAMPNGSSVTVSLTKDNGGYVSVYAGATDTNTPYRKVYVRQFNDKLSYNESNIQELVDNINTTFTSNDGIEWEVIHNIPSAWDDVEGVVKIDNNTIVVNEDDQISVNPSAIDIVDLHNASVYLSGTLQGSFDENAVEVDFTYSSGTTYSIIGQFYRYAPSAGDITLNLGNNTYVAGDILLCTENVDTTLNSSNFFNYFVRVPDSNVFATATIHGTIRLTNDLGGTADNPVVEHVNGGNVEYTDTSTGHSITLEFTDGVAYMIIDDGL